MKTLENYQNLTPCKFFEEPPVKRCLIRFIRAYGGGGSGGSGVTTFNTRSGDVTLLSSDVNTALGYTPPQSTASLLIAATDISGNLIDGTANVVTRPLTGFVTTTGTIVATDTILMGFNKAQGQLNQKIQLNSGLTGFTTGANTGIAAADTVLQAFGKAQGQINARAPIISPTFTGTPAAPTATTGTNTTQIATTAFVQSQLTASALLLANFKGGQTPFTADGIITQVNITHNLGAIPLYFTLTTTEPVTANHLNRTVTFPDNNTMRITFNVAPLVGEDANYVWIVYK